MINNNYQHNQIGAIYTTVSGGKTHIAADDRYIGSVESYNNGITRFFAWLFDSSTTVNFDGKTRSVNKKSYQQLLHSLASTNTQLMNLSERSVFRRVAEAGTLPDWNMKMRDAISDADRQSLFRKLAHAISSGNTDKAVQMIGKGAALDLPYYDRGITGPSFYTDTDGLKSASRHKFTVFKATPLMQAAMKANQTVVNRLIAAGANLDVTGHQYTFERTITDVRQNLDFVLEPTVHFRSRRHPHTHVDYHPRLRQRTTVVTEDTRSDERLYRFSNGVNVAQSKA